MSAGHAGGAVGSVGSAAAARTSVAVGGTGAETATALVAKSDCSRTFAATAAMASLVAPLGMAGPLASEASCAARPAAATNPAEDSGQSNFASTRSSRSITQAVGRCEIPIRRVISVWASTSSRSGSKQAVTSAIASSDASDVFSRFVLASLHCAVNTTSTGRWLTSEAAFASARSTCHGTPA